MMERKLTYKYFGRIRRMMMNASMSVNVVESTQHGAKSNCAAALSMNERAGKAGADVMKRNRYSADYGTANDILRARAPWWAQ